MLHKGGINAVRQNLQMYKYWYEIKVKNMKLYINKKNENIGLQKDKNLILQLFWHLKIWQCVPFRVVNFNIWGWT